MMIVYKNYEIGGGLHIHLVEMPMGILRMKKSAHPKKKHYHSHKRY
jgi:hypothetical protein